MPRAPALHDRPADGVGEHAEQHAEGAGAGRGERAHRMAPRPGEQCAPLLRPEAACQQRDGQQAGHPEAGERERVPGRRRERAQHGGDDLIGMRDHPRVEGR